MRAFSARALLRATTALVVLAATPAAVSAQDAFVLDEIFVNQSKREVQTDTAVSVTEVEQEEINDRQASTIAELVDSVPGVSLVNGSTPQGSGITIRGLGSNSTFGSDQKVAITADGSTVGGEELYRLGTQLFTDPSLYKSVTVQRGSVGSFEYGSGIIGGLIQLETKDASDFTEGPGDFVLRQTLGYESNGNALNSSTILAWEASDSAEFLFNYTYSERKDNQEDGNGDEIGNSTFELPSYLLKGNFQLDEAGEHSIEASISRTTTDDKDVPYDTFITAVDAFGSVDRQVDSRNLSIRYNFNPADNDLVDLDVALTYADQKIDQQYLTGSSVCEFAGPGGPTVPEACWFDIDRDGTIDPFTNFWSFFPIIGLDPSGTQNADHRYETTKLAFKNTSVFTTGNATHELRAGLEFVRKERKDASAAPGGVNNRVAVFIVDDIQIDNLTISPALRWESSDIDPFDDSEPDTSTDALMGGLSVRYEAPNGFAVFGSAAYTESLPIIDDIGSSNVTGSGVAFADASEKATTYELGFSYEGTDVLAAGDALALKAVAYQTEIEEITFTGSGSIDSIELRGLELEASYAFESGVYVDLNANVTSGTQTTVAGVETDWANLTQDTVRFTVGRRFGETLDLSWEALFAASYEDEDQNLEFDSFNVHNLRATYKPDNGLLAGTELRVGLENVFDTNYRPKNSSRNGPGRNIKLTVAREF